MTIKQRLNPSEDFVAIGGGTAAVGVAGCAAKYGAAKVAGGVAAVIKTASKSIPVIKAGADLGSLLISLMCPEVAIIGGLIILGTALYEIGE